MDRRAVRTLFNTFWSAQGWRPERERHVSPEEFAQARAAGVMFDPMVFEHGQTFARLREAIDALDPRRAGDAFAASLSTRRMDWRSAFGSYTVFRHAPGHEAAGARSCGVCGMHLGRDPVDLNVLNFERLKWGGVRHTDPVYALLDLELFCRGSRPQPTAEDVELLGNLLALLERAPAGTTAAQLQAMFPKELKGNKAERDVIVAMLGFAGALATDAHSGFSAEFVPINRRELPPRRFVDTPYPACWWRMEDGFRRTSLEPYFGHLIEF